MDVQTAPTAVELVSYDCKGTSGVFLFLKHWSLWLWKKCLNCVNNDTASYLDEDDSN